jgi:hypothetical protein
VGFVLEGGGAMGSVLRQTVELVARTPFHLVVCETHGEPIRAHLSIVVAALKVLSIAGGYARNQVRVVAVHGRAREAGGGSSVQSVVSGLCTN